MNTIGINHNLDRQRIRKLLLIGLIAGSLLGFLGIFGYIWLAPIGCHMNLGLMNYAYKKRLKESEAI